MFMSISGKKIISIKYDFGNWFFYQNATNYTYLHHETRQHHFGWYVSRIHTQ